MNRNFIIPLREHEVKVDVDELPHGHSGSLKYKTDDCEVVLCRGNTISDDRQTVFVTFPKMHFRVQGGKSLWFAMKDEPEEKWHDIALAYTIGWLSAHGTLVQEMAAMFQKAVDAGIYEGKQLARKQMREALDLDE